MDRDTYPCYTKRIEYSGADHGFAITFLGDMHLGSKHCDEALLQQDIDTIKANPNARWIGMGDMCEWIQRSDPRYNPAERAKWLPANTVDIAGAECDYLVNLLYPIKDKCLGLIEGNHEYAILKHNERDVCSAVAKGLELPVGSLLGPAGFLRLVFSWNKGKTFTLRTFLTHGWWSRKYYSSAMFPLEHLPDWIDADLFVCAHNHHKGAFPVGRLACDRGNSVYTKEILCVSTGAYLKPSGYSVRRGYKPSQLGAKTVDVNPYYQTLRTETSVGL